jgi:hypothetical protein
MCFAREKKNWKKNDRLEKKKKKEKEKFATKKKVKLAEGR